MSFMLKKGLIERFSRTLKSLSSHGIIE